MSRIGLKPIDLPAGVEVKVDGNVVTVKGPNGELQETISELIDVNIEGNVVTVSRNGDAKEERSQHGLARTLIANMVEGVSKGFEKKLEIQGVGYRADKKGDTLVLSLADAAVAGIDTAFLAAYFAGGAAALGTGFFSVYLFRRLVRRRGYRGLAYYSLVIGVLSIILTLIF
jgi:hypothetical protein